MNLDPRHDFKEGDRVLAMYHEGGPIFIADCSGKERVLIINRDKPRHQRASRLHLMQKWTGPLPKGVEEAYAAWKKANTAREEAYAAWKKANTAREEAYAAYRKTYAAREEAYAAFQQSLIDNKDELRAIIEKEVPGFAYDWDDMRICYPKGKREGQPMEDA